MSDILRTLYKSQGDDVTKCAGYLDTRDVSPECPRGQVHYLTVGMKCDNPKTLKHYVNEARFIQIV